jgi:ATP-binding cassette subfamily B protein
VIRLRSEPEKRPRRNPDAPDGAGGVASLDPADAAPPPLRRLTAANVWRLSWRVSQHRPGEFWLGSALFLYFFVSPAVTGFTLSRGYQAIADGRTTDAYWWAVAVAVSEVARMTAVHHGALVWERVWLRMQSFLRANMLAAQMASGGPEAGQPVGSAGRAITYFRDDTEDVAEFVDNILDTTGGLMFAALAGFLLAAADWQATLILVIPLVGVVAVTRALDARIKRYRSADREATEQVTGLLGDMMAAATTVKVNDATDPMLSRLGVVVEERRHTAVRDRVLSEGVNALGEGAANIGLGLVLVVSAGAIASGAFDLGTLTLFTAYLGWLTFLPQMLGRVLARRRQVAVSFDRMRRLVADEDVENMVLPRDLPIGPSDRRVRPESERPQRVPLERMEVRGLTATHADGVGIRDVSFELGRGDFVVVTGPVGAGKSTLLRAVLGLVPGAEQAGEVRWNGQVIGDRAAFMVPPNAAFLPQVPQLISDSVADNVSLGPADGATVRAALELAAIEADVAEMPAGADTLIGPRGLRLSGGQRQRLATARALVHRPELVVLDDVSSALDVETELLLWDNLAAAGMTVIAVSHRAVAFDRADRVLRLADGRLQHASGRTSARSMPE